MLKKAALRLFRVLCVATFSLVAVLGVAGYLAIQVPDYYAAWQSREPTPEELQAATANIENARAAYLRWRSQVQGQGVAEPPAAHAFSFTDADLNALLASEGSKLGDAKLDAPRIRVGKDRVDVAVGVRASTVACVLSASLSPSLTPEGLLVLRIESLRIGSLPLPCETIASFFPKESHRLSGSLSLDLTDKAPRLTIDLADRSRSLLADSIECTPGKVTLRFIAHSAEG